MAANTNLIQDNTPGAKRMKSESLTSECSADTIHCSLSDFSGFELQRVLNENAQRKTVFIQGSFKERKGQAIVILEKTPFDEKSIDGILSANSRLKKDFSNDIYGNYECSPEIQFNNIKATIIHPATEKHIQKYESQPVHIIDETPEFYHTLTLPHLQKEQFNLQWVTNIIDHKSEVERIIFEDTDPETGFILLPDLKWDAKQVENLYIVAIVRKTGIFSLRSLTGYHLNLLKNLQAKGIKAIEDRYHIAGSQLRVYLHYQPSFYHLHVHFTNLQYEAPGIYPEKAHLLSTVISNLELMSDFYQKATLPFAVKESDNLFSVYEEKGLVKRRGESIYSA